MSSSGTSRAAGSWASRGSGRASSWTWIASTRDLFEGYGTIVGPGHWFEQSDRSFRLGFGWPTLDDLRGGLAAISETAANLARSGQPRALRVTSQRRMRLRPARAAAVPGWPAARPRSHRRSTPRSCRVGRALGAWASSTQPHRAARLARSVRPSGFSADRGPASSGGSGAPAVRPRVRDPARSRPSGTTFAGIAGTVGPRPGSFHCGLGRRQCDQRRRLRPLAPLRTPVPPGAVDSSMVSQAATSVPEPVVRQGMRGSTVAAGHRPGGDQGVRDGFLGRLDDRPEQRADPGVDERRQRARVRQDRVSR